MQFPEFEGHFPGQPLVPGAAILVAVDAAVRAQTGRGIVRLDRVRFLAPVLPGEEVTIRVRIQREGGGESGGEAVRFGVDVGAIERVRGVARLAEAVGSSAAGGAS